MIENSEHPPDGNGAWSALGTASREKADAFLEEQTVLARLQADDLRREDRLRHWSLRVRHMSDVLKLSFEVAVAALLTALVVLIVSAAWSAAHDEGLVIEAFKVPPDMLQKGLTGDVVASQLLDRLTDLQNKTDSSRAASTYTSDWGNDIKVEIPNTGISISEAYRYLAGWLGHQTHISGEVFHTDNGIALSVRVSGNAAIEFNGRELDLKTMLTRAAEGVYRQTQPYRYAIYLTSHNRNVEEEVVLRELALNGSPEDRPWAYSVWAFSALNAGNNAEMLRRGKKAVELQPFLGDAQNNLALFEGALSHPEQMVAASRAAVRDFTGPGAHFSSPHAARVITLESLANIDEAVGDYADAVAQYGKLMNETDFEGSHWLAVRMASADAALAHDVSNSRQILGSAPDADLLILCCTGFGWQPPNFDMPQFRQFAVMDDWRDGLKDIKAMMSVPHAAATKPQGDIGAFPYVATQVWPMLALAQTKTGATATGRETISKTTLDCYTCLVVRGQIASVTGDRKQAEDWFERAIAFAPSIPFAYVDWGQMLLAAHDYDSAIAKFTVANQKGPHFADPLEMWGEALIAKNRSDLAAAKFEEAHKYAPNWGRLHLKWGEALLWSGDKVGAQKQFAIASHLDLTQAERGHLGRMKATHV
jgi:tetratricopeptide (TPR) repeat protein